MPARGRLLAVVRSLAVCVAVSAAAALGWLLLAGGSYRPTLGLALVVVAAVLALTGGTGMSRLGEMDARAWLGAGPARDEPTGSGELTPFGVFLLVTVPLFLLGGVIYGRG